MSKEKPMTAEETSALVRDIIATIPQSEFDAFEKIHQAEIAREYQIILLLYPDCVKQYTESMLRQAALVIIFAKHSKDDDGWGRPRKPTPEPPTPQGNGARKVLEPA